MTNSQNKRLAVLTSGGDAPGMNAAIRAIVRVGCAHGLEIIGVRRGYRGLLAADFLRLNPRDVSNIIQRGGTILKTTRCPEFASPESLKVAAKILEQHEIAGLIVIGGDGTLRGANDLAKFWKGIVIGLPGTIDNDLYGTDCTIGFDTALLTALEAIDKIRDTADAHERFFLVEVMGRHSGFIALHVGIAAGAEGIVLPERPLNVQGLCHKLCAAREQGKTSSIIVVAEGKKTGGAFKLAEDLRQLSQNEYRVVILGHLQRGGTPTTADRLLATKLGAYAVGLFGQETSGVLAGEVRGQLCTTPLEEAVSRKKNPDEFLLNIHPLLST